MKTKLVTLLFFLFPLISSAAPNRPECIAPARPGGGFDLTCKLVQSSLQESKILDKPLKITYMPGGVGTVAYNAVINQRAKDGNIIVAFSSGSLLNIAQGKFGKYDENAVRWLATVGTDYGMLAVREDSDYKNLEDLVNDLKTDPQSVTFGAGGSVGGQDWIKSALVARLSGVDPKQMRYVAFEGGGEVLSALLGGHIKVMSGDISEVVPHVKAGKLRVLAVFSSERLDHEDLKDIRTAKEQGYDVDWPTIRGFYVGPEVSESDYQWWLNAFKNLYDHDSFEVQRDSRGLFEFNKTGAELDKFVKDQTKVYRDLAKSFGLIQ